MTLGRLRTPPLLLQSCQPFSVMFSRSALHSLVTFASHNNLQPIWHKSILTLTWLMELCTCPIQLEFTVNVDNRSSHHRKNFAVLTVLT